VALVLLMGAVLAAAPVGAAGPDEWAPVRWPGGPLELQRRAREATLPEAPALRDTIGEWYDPATLELLRGTSVNCLLVTWSAGGDPDTEATQHRLVAAYARAARARGIAVLGLVHGPAPVASFLDPAIEAELDGLVLDGIQSCVGGEGPWVPGSRALPPGKPGLLVVGRNAVCTDTVAAALMGYDPRAVAGTRPFSVSKNKVTGAYQKEHGDRPQYADNILLLAEAAGLGSADLGQIEVVGGRVKDLVFVNRDAADHAVRVPPELFELVSAAIEYSRRSEGAFDITVGPLVKAWGFHDGSGRLARPETILQARVPVGYANVLLDASRQTIRFARAGVELDPSGIGKGYAVDRMVRVLRDHGIERALVSAAGSSLYALGTPPGQDGWPVRLAANVRGAAVRLSLVDESLSTSGRSSRSFRANGRTYGHVLDPRTGVPVAAMLAAVVSPRAIDSEAWTKAVLVNGRAWSARHTPREWRALLCDDDRPDSCGWVRGDSVVGSGQ
jgi:thiamine biosynthesis lipoprotein